MKPVYSDACKIVYEQLGKFFREKRLEIQKSQRISAYEYGIPKSLLSRIERGENDPHLSSIITLCVIYKVKWNELLAVFLSCMPKVIALIED